MEEVCEFLKQCGIYYIATCEGDQPRVRPFSTVHIYNGRLYFQTGKVKPVSHQLAANPKVEICGFHKGQWVRVAGTAVEDPSLEAQKSLLDAYPSLQGKYAPGDGNNQVFYLKDATASFAVHGQKPRIVTF
ncbi:MAG: pyridoxamine 5'-phosphate oxidase family protein [Oscillospiraceae bacterium]|nr:pyridoxamine 5'-phosphate oxidase family protein [Oscillospiraceae bacterium]